MTVPPATAPDRPDPTWRSPLLGDPRRLDLAAGGLDYFDRGRGPCLVLAHGWLANANLWRHVVDQLSDRFRCVTLDLPLGSHRTAMPRGADLSPTGVAGLIAAAVEALDLHAVTLVGNDSGGAYAQIALAGRRDLDDRVTGLVLTSCETPYDPWPPPPFDQLPVLARDPLRLRELLLTLRDPDVRMSPPAYGLLLRGPIDPRVFDSYALAATADDAILRDVAAVMAATGTAPVRDAGLALTARRDLPVLLVWSAEDVVFPVEHARRYAATLHNGRLEVVSGSRSFTPEDRPDALADAIAGFAATSTGASAGRGTRTDGA